MDEVVKEESPKKNKKKLLLNSILVIFVLALGISIYGIIKYKIDENGIDGQLDLINDNVTIADVEDSENTEVVSQEEEVSESNPYWDYIKMNLIDVDFQKLKSINEHTRGWIQVNGTNINYPFVQTDNNDYYLKHSFNGSANVAGWVFLDYRNDLSNFNNKNTIIYAHGMNNKTMFGSLRNILTNNWLDNTDNYIIKLSTEYENTLWQVFSVYRIPTTSDYIQTTFYTDKKFAEFTELILNRSSHDFNTKVSTSDRILTLSTCYDESEKVVLHAKLIKREAK